MINVLIFGINVVLYFALTVYFYVVRPDALAEHNTLLSIPNVLCLFFASWSLATDKAKPIASFEFPGLRTWEHVPIILLALGLTLWTVYLTMPEHLYLTLWEFVGLYGLIGAVYRTVRVRVCPKDKLSVDVAFGSLTVTSLEKQASITFTRSGYVGFGVRVCDPTIPRNALTLHLAFFSVELSSNFLPFINCHYVNKGYWVEWRLGLNGYAFRGRLTTPDGRAQRWPELIKGKCVTTKGLTIHAGQHLLRHEDKPYTVRVDRTPIVTSYRRWPGQRETFLHRVDVYMDNTMLYSTEIEHAAFTPRQIAVEGLKRYAQSQQALKHLPVFAIVN